MLFEEFQDGGHGCHLGYLNRMILANLNLHATLMTPIKFQFNPLGFWRCCLKNFKMAATVAILDIRTELFDKF